MPVEASLAEPADFTVECSLACDVLPLGSVVLAVDAALEEAMLGSQECQDAVHAAAGELQADGAVTEVKECLKGVVLYASEQDGRYFVGVDGPAETNNSSNSSCSGVVISSLILQLLDDPSTPHGAILSSVSFDMNCKYIVLVQDILENIPTSGATAHITA